MNAQQLRELIIKPTLVELDMYSQEAEDLIAGTIAQESRMGHYIKQVGGGPALGICQMEAATHDNLWENYIKFRPDMAEKVYAICPQPNADTMIYNLRYAVAMCRIHYWRKPEKIPHDILEQAQYWKTHYNTVKGKGTVAEYVRNYGRAIRK